MKPESSTKTFGLHFEISRLFLFLYLRTQVLHPLSSNHTGYADDDEGNGEQLAHIEQHARLEVYLYVLCVLDEEAERKDER
jgi:hypothetical protein